MVGVWIAYSDSSSFSCFQYRKSWLTTQPLHRYICFCLNMSTLMGLDICYSSYKHSAKLYFKYIINILCCKLFSFSDKYQINHQSGHYYVRIDISAKTAFNCHHCIMCSGISHLGHVTEHWHNFICPYANMDITTVRKLYWHDERHYCAIVLVLACVTLENDRL